MKIFHKFIKAFFYFLSIALILYILTMIFFPEKINDIINYKSYIVLTNSMEPKIPTYSFVFIKNLKKMKL